MATGFSQGPSQAKLDGGCQSGEAEGGTMQQREHRQQRWRALLDMEPAGQGLGMLCLGKKGSRAAKGAEYENLFKTPCGPKGLLEGIGDNHKVVCGWLGGVLSTAFCAECGRFQVLQRQRATRQV